MKNWFLYRVYKLDKRLFIFFLLFVTGTLFTNLLGWQATPFFVWGMFSEKETDNNYPVLKITANDSSVIDYSAGYTDANRFFLRSPLEYYILMKQNNGMDATESFLQRKLKGNYSVIENVAAKVLNGQKEYQQFLPWYKRYLEQTTHLHINNFKIEVLQTRYTNSHDFKIYSTQLIDTWQQ